MGPMGFMGLRDPGVTYGLWLPTSTLIAIITCGHLGLGLHFKNTRSRENNQSWMVPLYLPRASQRRPAFADCQAECWKELYLGHGNMVVTAPTGAGKTVLFELAILGMQSPQGKG
jgi:type IV secretory pathway VirB4 component